MENYNVTLAEKLMPSAELSEQISLAGTEAAGTGNMKLMLNGAITIGTLDGANIEIANAVGNDNIFIFGMQADEVDELKQNGYYPSNYLNNNNELKEAVMALNNGMLGKTFNELYINLTNHAPYMVIADFADYRKTQLKASDIYCDSERFAQMSLMNISGAGKFSADRAVKEYADNIWHIKPVKTDQIKNRHGIF